LEDHVGCRFRYSDAILVDGLVKPITNIDDPRYVKAMSHPLRVRILALLDEHSASPVELASDPGAR
jgi:hypothetical protein